MPLNGRAEPFAVRAQSPAAPPRPCPAMQARKRSAYPPHSRGNPSETMISPGGLEFGVGCRHYTTDGLQEADIQPRFHYQRNNKETINCMIAARSEWLLSLSVRGTSFLIREKPCAQTTYWAVQSPRGDPWPEIFNYSAAIAGRTSPSPLLIRRSFRNAVTRPRSA